jgi:hypothetical protein
MRNVSKVFADTVSDIDGMEGLWGMRGVAICLPVSLVWPL